MDLDKPNFMVKILSLCKEIQFVQHTRMKKTEEVCVNSKKAHQNSQGIQVQATKVNKEIQTWMGSPKRYCTCPTT